MRLPPWAARCCGARCWPGWAGPSGSTRNCWPVPCTASSPWFWALRPSWARCTISSYSGRRLGGGRHEESTRRRREALLAELRQDLAAVESYEEQHGSFPELVRAHYEREDGSV